MSEALRVSGDLVVAGAILGATQIQQPAGSIVDADVSASAAIAASKLQRSLTIHIRQTSTAADETCFAHLVRGATGTLRKFYAGCQEASIGASVVTVDLTKNGSSVLASKITLNVLTGITPAPGVITISGVVAGDLLMVVIDGIWSGSDALAKGIYAQLDMDEAYAL